MSYKWKAGDWAIYGSHLHKGHKVTSAEAAVGNFWDGVTTITLASCTPVIVRDKPQPKKVKRSELRTWFERQVSPWAAYNPIRSCGAWHVTTNGGAHSAYGPTFEAAIIAHRKALRKAGKFTP